MDLEGQRVAVQALAGPFAGAARQAESTASNFLDAAERGLFALGRRGCGVVPREHLQTHWFWFEYGPRKMIAVNLSRLPSDLPADHCLRGLGLNPGELYAGTSLVLGPGVVSPGDRGWVVRPRDWYSLGEARRWSAACERQRVRDEADARQVSEVLAARQKARDEEAERADPVRRMQRVERELAELKAR
jgi:hypothetical protein